MYPPGLRLRQARERLGLTYREVERASFAIAVKRGRPDFILHISRLADIENRNVVPSLHKLYSLATIYHLDATHISGWYEVPFPDSFQDGKAFPPQLTHLGETSVASAEIEDLQGNSEMNCTGFLGHIPFALGGFPSTDPAKLNRFRYGYIGLSDRRMAPILRPGSMVLVDTSQRHVDDVNWSSEYDRPIYFVELRDGYACSWCELQEDRLLLIPHPLSPCHVRSLQYDVEAEIVGQVTAVAMRITDAAGPENGANGELPNRV